MQPTAKQGSIQGGLLSAPHSWLHLLIQHLPANERLVLFQTCRSLATAVAHSVPSIKLCFGSKQHPQTTAESVVQCRAITALLAGCTRLHVVLCTRQLQAFPWQLNSSITEVTFKLGWDGPSTNNFCWDRLQGLRAVAFQGYFRRVDIDTLCEAIEAGHLPALCSVVWHAEHDMHEHDGTQAVALRFARAVGKQVTNLDTNNKELMQHLECFPVLESVTIRDRLSKAAAQELCAHAAVKCVTIAMTTKPESMYNMFSMEGDHSQCGCSWSTLTFHGVSPAVMAALPLACVPTITIVHSVPLISEVRNNEHIRTLQGVLTSYSHKLSCVPDVQMGGDTLCLDGCSEPELCLLKLLKGVHTLYVVKQQSYSDLCNLYKALPSCIYCLHFETPKLVRREPLQVWQGLPHHITHVQLKNFDHSISSLRSIVTSTPEHVRKLVLKCPMLANVGAWYDVLLAAAPSHLTLAMKEWH